MNYILYDIAARLRLLPFTHTRPVADIRCGILTMRERWEQLLQQPTGSLTEQYLQPVFPLTTGADNIYINGGVFGTASMTQCINDLQAGQKLVSDDIVIAFRSTESITDLGTFHAGLEHAQPVQFNEAVTVLKNLWDIFSCNDKAIREDFELLTAGRKSTPIPEGVIVTGKEHLFIEEGANIYAGCIINAGTGPVYIAKDTEVLEGTLIRGPLAVCDHAVIKMGAKVYGATTIGPGCKVGGELNNVIFFANSNKAHDGYLGNSVIGEWCNLGADTNCSNLKNNYAEVKIWDEANNRSVSTGLTFCGLFMGDHSKCSINTMFNTGTVVGVSCNIFGSSFPEKYIRSFSWGGSESLTNYDFTRAMETAGRMMARRGRKLSDAETEMYKHLYDKVQNFLSPAGIL